MNFLRKTYVKGHKDEIVPDVNLLLYFRREEWFNNPQIGSEEKSHSYPPSYKALFSTIISFTSSANSRLFSREKVPPWKQQPYKNWTWKKKKEIIPEKNQINKCLDPAIARGKKKNKNGCVPSSGIVAFDWPSRISRLHQVI